MEVRKVESKHWCSICDEKLAVVEICDHGSLKLYWACSETDNEIGLCRECFEELKHKINDFKIGE